MSSFVVSFLLIFICLVLWNDKYCQAARRRYKGYSTSRDILILNESGFKVDIFWVDPEGKRAHSNTEEQGLAWGGESSINTYVGHTFEMEEMPNRRTRRCKYGPGRCQKVRFTVSGNEDQIYTLWKNFTITVQDHRTRAMDKAKDTLQECSLDDRDKKSMSTEKQVEALTNCMKERIEKAWKNTEEEIAFQASIRTSIGRDLARYSCLDNQNATDMTTTSISNFSWSYLDPMTQERQDDLVLETLFETTDASGGRNAEAGTTALLVRDFISMRQCQALEQNAATSTIDQKNLLAVPQAAKKDLQVLKLLLKVQKLVESTMNQILRFAATGDHDKRRPLMTYLHQQSRKTTTATTAAAAAAASQQQQVICEDTKGGAGVAEQEQQEGACSLLGNNDNGEMETHYIPPGTSGTIFFFCPSSGGAVHFPRTGVHLPAPQVVGSALLIIHDEMEIGDAYMGEYVVCIPQQFGTSMSVFEQSFTL